MDKNVSSFPNPPKFYKLKLDPPKPPAEGEFSMFGKTYTTKETPLRIETVDFPALFTDEDLNDHLFFTRNLLVKLQNSLMNAARVLLKALAENPSEAVSKFQEYEKIAVNFHQLLYWLRPSQALLEVKMRLVNQIEGKDRLKNELFEELQELKEQLRIIIKE